MWARVFWPRDSSFQTQTRAVSPWVKWILRETQPQSTLTFITLWYQRDTWRLRFIIRRRRRALGSSTIRMSSMTIRRGSLIQVHSLQRGPREGHSSQQTLISRWRCSKTASVCWMISLRGISCLTLKASAVTTRIITRIIISAKAIHLSWTEKCITLTPILQVKEWIPLASMSPPSAPLSLTSEIPPKRTKEEKGPCR